ncbi:hypothetical protein GO755_40050 [Spirosoma sp. HMF4905]|uniref:Alpha/beta hydrolase n=1 Tax=Spirosoma arboris TaxID=2682092 RepID=A0A7K1SR96_9BACT|nr:alpha/beta hydrolase-fold protein [Spirosoma arboris]MVM36270.1 hypothetical protein [Spirosoma arboris]
MGTLRLFATGPLSVWFVLLFSPLASSQDKPAPIVIGESITIHSTILQEDRSILIYKPDGYTESTARYPVLYLLDAEAHLVHTGSMVNYMASLGIMPKLLIVGIINADRGRDMTPKPKNGVDKDFPSGGGAEQFLSFINQEVKPFIKSHYRTDVYEILAGTSLSGLFSINTLLTHSTDFNAYFAISPALWWDKQAVPQVAETVLTKAVTRKTFLYFTLCPDDSELLQESTNRLKRILENRQADGLSWQFKFISDETHNSVVHLGLYWALKALYKNWQLAQVDNLAKLEQHYRLLSAQYGYPIEVPEEQLNSLGYQLLFGGKAFESIAVFKRNVARFPTSSNAYDSLGDAYKLAGELLLAKSSYEKAYSLGKEANSLNLASYLNNVEQVKKLINQQSQKK